MPPSGLSCWPEVSLRYTAGYRAIALFHLSCFQSLLRGNEGWPQLENELECGRQHAAEGHSTLGDSLVAENELWWEVKW